MIRYGQIDLTSFFGIALAVYGKLLRLYSD